MILEAEVATRAVGMEVRPEIFERRVPADVAVKLAVNGVARIADLRAPDLLRSFHVAGKNRHAITAQNRRVNAETRARIAVQNRVRIADEILDSVIL